MSEFIVAGIILLAGVNWLYSRFCESEDAPRVRPAGCAPPSNPLNLMTDLIFISVTAVFFILSVLYVRFCDRL